MKSIFLFLLIIMMCQNTQAQCVSGNCNNGTGTFISQDGTKYEGKWEDGKKTQGTTFYTNGDKYIGAYLNNARHGEGAYYYKSGNRFEGIFVKGKKVKGIFYYEDNSRYEGQFENDKKHGNGSMYYADGRVEEGLWQDDKYIDELGERAFAKTYAVVVGIAKYAHPKMLLGAADEGAQKFADFLKTTAQVPEGNVKLLLNEAATKAGITVAIREIFAEAKPEDRVIFYFAGHGAEGVFVPYDYLGEKEMLLLHSDLKVTFKNCKAKYKIFLSEACILGSLKNRMKGKNEAVADSSTTLKYIKAFPKDDNITVFMAARPALPSGGTPQGIFTTNLIKGMGGLANANNDRIINLQELFDYTRMQVRMMSNNAQTPLLWGQFDLDMPIMRVLKK
jgi:hypothetical protein